MPLIDVKLYRGRLAEGDEKKLIAELTDAVARVLGDGARAQTWIVVQEVPATHWGIGGEPGA